MLAVSLKNLPLHTTWTDANPQQRAHSTFPLLGGQENEGTSVVYVELDAGQELGTHTDSAEEVLLILEGSVEVTVGDERAVVDAPSLAVVPTMLPHNLRNVGQERVKFAGFFPSRYLVATFDNVWLPDGSNVVDTKQIEAAFS